MIARRCFALAIAFALTASACVSVAPAPPADPAARETPQTGGRIVEGALSDVRSLQPMLVTDATSRTVTEKIYESLIVADPKSGEIRPNLGKWSVSADSLTYTWEIAAAASWSDGKPIVAEDWLTGVKATARSKRTTRKSNFIDIEGFAAYRDGTATSISGIKTDGKKFTVTFTKVFCPALVNAFQGYVIPTHVFGKYTVDADPSKNIDDAPENMAPPVASGPFTLKEWRRGDQVILSRNQAYWKGAPLLDEYVLKVLQDAQLLATQLKTGELGLGVIEPMYLEDLEREPHLKVHKYQALSLTFVGWNTRSQSAPGLRDTRVRQALAHGLDMDAVIKTVLAGQGARLTSFYPPASWAAAQGLNEYKYDRARAEELIRQAGFSKGADGFYAKEGKTLGFTLLAPSGNRVREKIQQVAVEQYRLIGVQVTPSLLAMEALIEKLSTGDRSVEAYIIGINLGLEPDPFQQWHSTTVPDAALKRTGFNATGFSSPELDRAIEDGRTGDCSQAARKRAYDRVSRILNEEQPYNFGFAPLTLLVAPADLRGLDPGGYGVAHNIEKWWLRR